MAFCPLIGKAALDACDPLFNLKISYPTKKSADRTAFLPGMIAKEKMTLPPGGAGDLINSVERAPEAVSTVQVTMNPSTLGGTPLTANNSSLPSSLKIMLEAVPTIPCGGVVWLRPRERQCRPLE